MMTAVQIINTICKPLADSPSLFNYVQMARESLDSRFFGKSIERAIAYKACHLYTLFGSDSTESAIAGLGGGQVSQMSEGGLSVSFDTGNKKSDSELGTTKYGRMLLQLIKNKPRINVNRNPMGVCL